jgi:signal transduction histidine kinase
MVERMKNIGGTLIIDSTFAGTTVTASVALTEFAQASTA